jgi:hypothetical protein
LAGWGGPHLYAWKLRSGLQRSAGALVVSAFEGYGGDESLAPIVQAGEGIRYAASTEREISDLWGGNAPVVKLGADEGAFLYGFLRLNRERLTALRDALPVAKPAVSGGVEPYRPDDEDIEVAWWSWRLMGTAALMYAGGESGRAMSDLLAAFRVYRAMSISGSVTARLTAVSVLRDTMKLAQRVVLSLPDDYKPGPAWDGLSEVLERARGDLETRIDGSVRLFEADYIYGLLHSGRGRGVWSRIMLFRAAASREQRFRIGREKDLLRKELGEELAALECFAAGLDMERSVLEGGAYADPSAGGYDVLVARPDEHTIILSRRGSEVNWTTRRRGKIRPAFGEVYPRVGVDE